MTFDDRAVMITGAARGQGAAAARAFAERGAHVVLTDILDEEGEATAAGIGDRARYLHLDVTDPKEWRVIVDEVVETHGRVDVLVNNAGIWLAKGLLETTPDEYRRVVEVNQLGVFLGMHAVAPHMVAARRGVIVNISSTAGLQAGLPYWRPEDVAHAYTASKWAVRGMSRAAAYELARYGVRVVSLHPGLVDTAMIDGGHERLAAGVPLGRMASAEEIAETVVFVASDAAAYLTGAEIAIDGGATA